mmetsp:Transcript_48473/g.127996  ORF Transcript_48473/g.127996 Transcript_48473/m.127996 type:complete len:220 (-) Transcript_48473:188-847(-)
MSFGGAPPPMDRRPGDWICGGCGDLQFRRNHQCRRCGRPNTGGGEGQTAAEMAAQAVQAAQAGTIAEMQQAQLLIAGSAGVGGSSMFGGGGMGGGTKTVPCKFHMRRPGSCKNGDACFFSHSANTVAMDMSQLQPEQLPADWKTTYCKFWDSGKCSSGQGCAFGHGLEELRGGLTPRNMQVMYEAHMMLVEMLPALQEAGAAPMPPGANGGAMAIEGGM